MKRIKCKTCGRPRVCRPEPGQRADLIRTERYKGRDLRVSQQQAIHESCLPCRRKTEPGRKNAPKAKVYGEMTRLVIRKAKED